MNDFVNENVTTIIRTVGERTEELCRKLLEKQITRDNIYIVREIPFTEAVRKTFEMGILENRKWTFVVDADVLVRPGVIEEAINYAEKANKRVFKIEGKVIDKFLDSPREAGTHWYRTELMNHAIGLIPQPDGVIRPETYVRNAMKAKGFPFIKTDILTGLHDFEQYYRDIYRKCFIQAKKHYERAIKRLPEWEEKAKTDYDYSVALAGFYAGKEYKGNVYIDAEAPFLSAFEGKMELLHLCEKVALADYSLLENERYLVFMESLLRDISPDKVAGLGLRKIIYGLKNRFSDVILRRL